MEEEKIIIDYDMIIAAKSGSMQALGYILDRHSDYINRVVYHIAPWLNKQCREECSQEIMMALMRLIVRNTEYNNKTELSGILTPFICHSHKVHKS